VAPGGKPSNAASARTNPTTSASAPGSPARLDPAKPEQLASGFADEAAEAVNPASANDTASSTDNRFIISSLDGGRRTADVTRPRPFVSMGTINRRTRDNVRLSRLRRTHPAISKNETPVIGDRGAAVTSAPPDSHSRQENPFPKSRPTRVDTTCPHADVLCGSSQGDKCLAQLRHGATSPLQGRPAQGRLRRLGFHDLRHSFGSLAARAATTARELQEWMGHADAKTTARYTHYRPRGGESSRLASAFALADPASAVQANGLHEPAVSSSTAMHPTRTVCLLRVRFRGTRRNGLTASSGLPCRRSWVRVPSSAPKKSARRTQLSRPA
jgi:hypothetical protein